MCYEVVWCGFEVVWVVWGIFHGPDPRYQVPVYYRSEIFDQGQMDQES